MRREAMSLKIDIKLSEVSFGILLTKLKIRIVDFSLKKFFTI